MPNWRPNGPETPPGQRARTRLPWPHAGDHPCGTSDCIYKLIAVVGSCLDGPGHCCGPWVRSGLCGRGWEALHCPTSRVRCLHPPAPRPSCALCCVQHVDTVCGYVTCASPGLQGWCRNGGSREAWGTQSQAGGQPSRRWQVGYVVATGIHPTGTPLALLLPATTMKSTFMCPDCIPCLCPRPLGVASTPSIPSFSLTPRFPVRSRCLWPWCRSAKGSAGIPCM